MAEMTAYAPGTPCWVDVSTPDLEKAKAFYCGLFGWDATTDPEMGHYTRFTLGGKDVAGAMPTMAADQPIVWSTYIATDNADATARKASENGGQVVVPPMDVADLGRMAVFIDPTGAFFGVWQPGTFIGAGRVNEPGSLVWNSLETRNVDAAKSFYTKIFPWTSEGGTQWTWNLDGRPVGGGIALDDARDMPPHWLVCFAVADSDAAVTKAHELGGTVIEPGMETPFGRVAVIADPQGAVFATIQLTQ